MDIGIQPTNESLQAYDELKNKKSNRYIIFSADKNSIHVEKVGSRDATYKDFINDLHPNEPRYCVFDYHYEFNDGRKTEKLVYIFWCPDTAKVQQKMIAATCNQSFKAKISGISHFLQANDQDDLSEASLISVITKI